MSVVIMLGARLFTHLQDAAFYSAFHEAAADLLGPGNGRSWLDVGTGPGLLARLAAERGYLSYGIDRSASMISKAARLARERKSQASFAAIDVETELASGRRYDVVSASSLIVVTPDPFDTLQKLERLVAPGGRLLVIEATAKMTLWRAVRMLVARRLGSRGYMLLPWAAARSGRALDPALMQRHPAKPAQHSMLDGMVITWVLERAP